MEPEEEMKKWMKEKRCLNGKNYNNNFLLNPCVRQKTFNKAKIIRLAQSVDHHDPQ